MVALQETGRKAVARPAHAAIRLIGMALYNADGDGGVATGTT